MTRKLQSIFQISTCSQPSLSSSTSSSSSSPLSSLSSASPPPLGSLFFFQHLELHDIFLCIRRAAEEEGDEEEEEEEEEEKETEERRVRKRNGGQTKPASAPKNKAAAEEDDSEVLMQEYLWEFAHPFGHEEDEGEARSHLLEKQQNISSTKAASLTRTAPASPPCPAAKLATVALNAWAFTELVKTYTAALERGLRNYDNVSSLLAHIHHVKALVDQLRTQSIPKLARATLSSPPSQCGKSSSSSSSSSSPSSPSSIPFIAKYKARWHKSLTLISQFETARKNLLDAVPILAGGERAVMFCRSLQSPDASTPPQMMTTMTSTTTGAQRVERCIRSKLRVIDEMEHACNHHLQGKRQAQKENEQQQFKSKTTRGNHSTAWEEIQSKLQQMENDVHQLELQFLA